MAWIIASSGEAYVGEVHEIGGVFYSGLNRTVESRRLVQVEDEPKPVRGRVKLNMKATK